MVHTQARKSFRIWGLQDLVWDLRIQTDKTLKHNLPDITVIGKKSEKCLMIYLAVIGTLWTVSTLRNG